MFIQLNYQNLQNQPLNDGNLLTGKSRRGSVGSSHCLDLVWQLSLKKKLCEAHKGKQACAHPKINLECRPKLRM